MGRTSSSGYLYLVERPDAGQFTYHRTLPHHLAGLVVGEVQLPWTGRTRRLLGKTTIKISFGTGDRTTARQRWSVLHPQIEALVQLASVRARQSAEPHTTADVPRLDPAQVRMMAEQAYHDVLATDDRGQVEPGYVTPVAGIILDLVRRAARHRSRSRQDCGACGTQDRADHPFRADPPPRHGEPRHSDQLERARWKDPE